MEGRLDPRQALDLVATGAGRAGGAEREKRGADPRRCGQDRRGVDARRGRNLGWDGILRIEF